jgi:hypothetical protein
MYLSPPAVLLLRSLGLIAKLSSPPSSSPPLALALASIPPYCATPPFLPFFFLLSPLVPPFSHLLVPESSPNSTPPTSFRLRRLQSPHLPDSTTRSTRPSGPSRASSINNVVEGPSVITAYTSGLDCRPDMDRWTHHISIDTRRLHYARLYGIFRPCNWM